MVPGMYVLFSSVLPRADLCCLALSQKQQWKIGAVMGSLGIPSTTLCVL